MIRQKYLGAVFDFPKSLKRSITYSQALRIKTICSTLTEYKKHCAILKQIYEIDKVDNIDRKDLLSKREKNVKDGIPCLIT